MVISMQIFGMKAFVEKPQNGKKAWIVKGKKLEANTKIFENVSCVLVSLCGRQKKQQQKNNNKNFQENFKDNVVLLSKKKQKPTTK